MWQAIVGIAGTIAGWFTTERVDKRRRQKIDRLVKEYEKIFKSTDSPANRTRIANILLELRRLRDEFAK